MKHQDALDQLARETARAGRRIALERALRAGFWLLAAIAAWASIALFGGHGLLPFLAQSLTAIAALVGFIYLALRARRAWQAPTADEARRRLASDCKLDRGTFETLEDQPTKFDAFSMALWVRERERALQLAEKVRARPPRPRLDDVDRFKLRYVLIALLIGGFLVAGPNAPDRLARAFLPDPGPLLGDREMAIEAWVSPADYTHAPPVSLSDRVGRVVATPPSVEATVRVTGPAGAPRLVYSGQGGRRQARFKRAPDGAWEAHLAIPGRGRLSIVRFHTRASWRLNPAPDARPQAAFTAPLAAAPEEHAVVAWRARDDFGVRALYLRVRPIHPPEGLARADAVDTELETPAGDPAEASGESTLDVAPHPYAGMEVEARLVAVDALGQEGVSQPMRFTMPEKVFLQPLARAAIEIRRHVLAERRPYRGERRPSVRRVNDEIALYPQRQTILIRDYDRRPALGRAPEGIRRAARLLDALTMAPQDGYFRDLAVFLGLRLARSELAAAQNITDTNLAADTLWRTALRAEYGGAADMRRAMDEAYRALADAMRQGAPPERIQQLVEALRRATEAYMQALVQEALRNGQAQNQEDTEEQASVSREDVNDMLNQVEQLARNNQMAAAAALLAMHQQLMQNLEARIDQQQSEGEGDAQSQEQMQQSMDQLSQAIGQQRELNNQTQEQREQQQREERQSQNGGSGGTQQGGQGGDELAQRQQEIREMIGQAQNDAEGAGAAPSPSLNDAQRAMRQAEDALRSGNLQGAEQAQAAALQSLREGAEAMAAEMREQGREGQQGQGRGAAGRQDPLGRDSGAGSGEGEANVPSRSDPVRARQIFDEISRRAQDPNRPESERDYLRRLLDRFGDS